MKVKVEKSRIDNRWCVYSPIRETLCPTWMVPIVYIYSLFEVML